MSDLALKRDVDNAHFFANSVEKRLLFSPLSLALAIGKESMPYDAKRILDTANSFLLAADRALESRSISPAQVQMLLVPAVVSTAFAIELYFKAIITLEGRNAKGHDLSKLFQQLSASSQATLIASLPIDSTQFQNELTAISHAFVEWRYIFEQQSANVSLDFLRRLSAESKKVAEALAASRAAPVCG